MAPIQRRGDEVALELEVGQASDRRGGIVGVQGGEDQVAGQSGLDGVLGRLGIADLTDHDDVGILPQDVPQGSAKVTPALIFTAVWLKAGETISIGSSMVVMLSSGVGDRGESRVEGRGLTRSGWAGDQDDAVRPGDEVVEQIELVLVEAERGEILDQDLRIEDAQHRLLAEGDWQRREA